MTGQSLQVISLGQNDLVPFLHYPGREINSTEIDDFLIEEAELANYDEFSGTSPHFLCQRTSHSGKSLIM